VDAAFGRLRARCSQVFVMGLSMGGCLALRLAEQHGRAVAGLVVVNPSLTTTDRRARFSGLLSRILPSVPGVTDDIKKPGVTEGGYARLPTRAFHSLRDLWAVTRLLLSRVASKDIEERLLAESYHVATLDNDAPAIFAGSLEFVRRRA
jgi:carboxylesterase